MENTTWMFYYLIKCYVLSHTSLIKFCLSKSSGSAHRLTGRATQPNIWRSAKLSISLYRATLCYRGICRRHVSVCLSVCPSVTSRCSMKTAKYRITHTTPCPILPLESVKLSTSNLLLDTKEY